MFGYLGLYLSVSIYLLLFYVVDTIFPLFFCQSTFQRRKNYLACCGLLCQKFIKASGKRFLTSYEPNYFRLRTSALTILSLYGKIQVRENPYVGLFYAVVVMFSDSTSKMELFVKMVNRF